jgi:putative ABC transport system permease protein
MLSLKNLFTKKGRTTLTAFAGSIGIIGIALILAISQGMTTYIDAVQETTLASYPLTLQATTVEMSTLMETFMNLHSDNEEHDKDAVYKKGSLYNMLNALNDLEERENDLKSFKKFLEAEMKKEGSALYEAVNGIQYSYNLNLQVYTKNVDGEIIYSDLEDIMTEVMMKALDMDEAFMESMQSMTSMSSSMGSMSSMGGMSAMTRLWQELLPGTNGAPVNDLILEQYDVVYGSWPNDYNEVVLVLDENNELDDLTLYALGLIEEKDIDALCDALKNGTKLDTSLKSWSYEEVCDREYKVILAADCYKYDEAQNKYIDLRNEKNGLDILYSNAMELKVTGVVRPAEDADATLISGGIAYTSDLTKHVIEKAEGLDVIEAQKKNPTVDVLTGLPFEPESDENDDANVVTDKDEKNAQAFKDYIAKLDEAGKAQAYITIKSIPSDEFVNAQVAQAMQGMTADVVRQQLMQAIAGQSSVDAATIEEYFNSLTDDEVMEMMKEAIATQIVEGYAAQVKAQMASASAAELAMGLAMEMDTYTVKECSKYYLAVAEFSTSTYENNLIEMGYVDIESPAAINLYASSFENKDVIADAIADYNEGKKEMEQIKYTDYIGIMMSSITTVIDAITYVLIAFVSISLIVSSIMIGVITLISVQERTKEIGILRAIGASKRNVSGMFNAETVIVGFAAGFLGVMVTYLLCIPINIILHEVTGIANLNAILPVPAAIILVAISVVLTLISGIIPSRSAAKKDPVVALRTES